MRALVLTCVALSLALPGAAGAADVSVASDSLIGIRQAYMELQQGNVSAMKAAVEAGGPVKPYTDGAKALAGSGDHIAALFPAGTESGHDTKAKPAVWSDRAGFEKAAANLKTQAEKLATLAEADDKAGFAAQFKETAGACAACHRAYKNR